MRFRIVRVLWLVSYCIEALLCILKGADVSVPFFILTGRWRVISKELRVNQEIRARQIRVIGDEGEQLGILSVREALHLADERGLDLVEVSPTTDPPVCKFMNYGKYKYEQAKKEKDAKVKRRTLEVKDVKLRPKIDDHDFQVKKITAERIIKAGDKVKVTMMFRGRELVHTALAEKLMNKLFEELSEISVMERTPKLEGKNMIMILAPKPSGQ